MANPQKEDGHIDIANEIAEALARWNMSSYEQRILWVVLRKTWGWHKKDDWISLSQFCVSTGLPRPHVCRSVKMLIQQNIITKGGTTYAPLYRIQKDFDKWIPLPKGARSHKSLPKGAMSVTKGGNEVVPKGAHTKETITKETITTSDVPSRDIVSIIDLFKDINPNYKKWFGNKTQRASIERMLSIHGKDRLISVVSFLHRSNTLPYVPTITSPFVLEEKWADLQVSLTKLKNKQIINQPHVII